MFKTMITCDVDALARDVEKAYGLEEDSVAIRELFFAGDYMNDSYKELCFSDDMWEDYKCAVMEEENDDNYNRLLVCKFLRDFFIPQGIESILVDVSW